MLYALLLGVVACSPAITPTRTVTSSASLQAKASTPTTLQALQQRPLHLPALAPDAACPTSPEKRVHPSFGIAQGDGPAYATVGTERITSPAVLSYVDAQHWQADNDGWGGQKVLWFVNPNYQGLVLVRGHQLDGPHQMMFNFDSPKLTPQLMLDTTLGGTPWPNFPSYTRLQAPGCYAYQVDGTAFSYTIVFEAVVQN